jgi:hypothetical protein
MKSVLGGVHLIMVGDWLQQSPVQGTLLLEEPNLFSDRDSVTICHHIQMETIRVFKYTISINCVVNIMTQKCHIPGIRQVHHGFCIIE